MLLNDLKYTFRDVVNTIKIEYNLDALSIASIMKKLDFGLLNIIEVVKSFDNCSVQEIISLIEFEFR